MTEDPMATAQEQWTARQQSTAERDAARQDDVHKAAETLLAALEYRGRGDPPGYLMLTKEDAARLCERLVTARPDTALPVALDWLTRTARVWVRRCPVGGPPDDFSWYMNMRDQARAVADELDRLLKAAEQ
jgi:hypothetical protein